MYVFLSASVSRHTERVLSGSTLGREAISQSITSWCDDQWTEPRSAWTLAVAISFTWSHAFYTGITGSSHIAAAQAMMTNLHTASWHHCCRGTWHQTSHDQWPTLTGDLETAQWLGGSSTPTAVNVNNSANICGKSHWTECCFCKQIFASVCLSPRFLRWWGGKCCGLWSITGDHQLRHMAWAWCSRRLAAPTSRAVLQRNWNVGLYVILCYV